MTEPQATQPDNDECSMFNVQSISNRPILKRNKLGHAMCCAMCICIERWSIEY